MVEDKRPHERIISRYTDNHDRREHRSRSRGRERSDPDYSRHRSRSQSRRRHVRHRGRSRSREYREPGSFFAERQKKRERRLVNIWPRSPSRSPSRRPSRSPSPPSPTRETDEALETLTPSTVLEQPLISFGGHQPVNKKLDQVRKEKTYGGDLLPGEGSAIAKYAASGARIPRRGEVGIESEQISKFEASGYVMSGSRHAVMNAVRLRKENQVLTVEGRRKLALEALQEKKKREEEIVKSFKNLINEKLRKGDSYEQ